ncbi:MAG: hypothetical protein ACRBK7_23705 [Acidimicrobiales bacterium]
MSSTRKFIGLLVFLGFTIASCGGTDESVGDTAVVGGESETEASETSTPTTSEAPTTAAPTTTTTTEPTTTEATLAPEDFERHLADALLRPEDLPDYMATVYENSMAESSETGILGDLSLYPCGEDVVEAEAIDARASYFTFKEGLEIDPQPILVLVTSTVRQLWVDGGSGIVAQYQEAATPCVYQEVTSPLSGSQTLVGPVIEVEERSGVRAVGSQAIDLETGVTVFNFAFETDSLDGYLVIVTLGTNSVQEEQELTMPLVELFQDRIAECIEDTNLCSALL